jgi:hypothetical protein
MCLYILETREDDQYWSRHAVCITTDVGEILKSKLHVRRLMTDKEYRSDVQQVATIQYSDMPVLFCSLMSESPPCTFKKM